MLKKGEESPFLNSLDKLKGIRVKDIKKENVKDMKMLKGRRVPRRIIVQ